MNAFRCFHCLQVGGTTVDFALAPDAPVVCPVCGLKKDGDGGEYIERLVVIHYEPPHPIIKGMKGCGYIACDHKVLTGKGFAVSTGETRNVNCPACHKTSEFKGDHVRGAVSVRHQIPDDGKGGGDVILLTAAPEAG